MNLNEIEQELNRRMQRQLAYFKDRQGHFLVFGTHTKGRKSVPYPPYGIPVEYLPSGETRHLTELYLKEHAFEIGVRIMRNVMVETENQMVLDDDACPSSYWLHLGIDYGTGGSAALFTGQDIVFQEITSYTTEPYLKTWDDLDTFRFNPDNRFIQYELEIWRGVASEYEIGLPVITHQLRSPLDLANDMRGSRLFIDLYDSPEKVEELLDRCTDSIIEYETYIRSEIPILQNAPGGCCGVALPQPGMLFINGDPIDLISPEMGDRFNKPYIERLAEFAGSIYFHHHSIGVTRIPNVGKIRGITVQEIAQDPNGPQLIDYLEMMVEPSLITPIHLHLQLEDKETLVRVMDILKDGRFIIHVLAETTPEVNKLIEIARKYE